MKKLYAKEIGIVFTALALILSIFAFVMLNNGSAAWFSDNTEVSAEGFGVSLIGTEGVTATLKSYPVSNISGDTFTADFTKESYELPVHDPNSITFLDVEEALVVELKVVAKTATSANIKLSASTDANSILGTAVAGTLNVNNYISNCIRIRNASKGPGSTLTAEAEINAKSHVTLLDGTAVKSSEITLTERQISSGETAFYFIIEYNHELLNHISKIMFNSHMGKNKVNYLNDIEFIIYN